MNPTSDGDDSSGPGGGAGGGPTSGDAGAPPSGSGGAAGEPEDAGVTVRVNGERRTVARGLTLSGLLEELGVDARRVAVERNRQVVPRDRRDEVELEEGDEVEIVQFVGGGR